MRLFIISLCMLAISSAQAQKITLVQATKQQWSGGVAGHFGTNYLVSIQCADTNIVPDTLWVGQNFATFYLQGADTFRVKRRHNRNEVTYNLYYGEGHAYDPADPLKSINEEREKAKNAPHRTYTGVALVTYNYMGRHLSFIVKSFSVLPALNYP